MDARQIQSSISEEVNRVVSRQQSELLSSLQNMMDSRLSVFQQNIQLISASQICKIEDNLNEHYVFRKKGNENQYKHEARVLTKLKEAREHLNCGSDDGVESAKSSIAEGIEMVKNRQKVIKLADSSQLGWKVVQEYQANPIADDSDDEKKMYRAQMRAERKVFNGRKRQRFEPYQKKPATVSRMETDERSTSSGKPGRCFDCGAKGHWSRDCTKKDDKANKISENLEKILPISNLALFNDISSIISPVGRLRSRYSEWEKIGTGKTILDIIKSGYKIPFKTNPSSIELNNNRSAREEPEFVTGEIRNLIEKGCVSRVREKPTVVNPLTVAKNRNGYIFSKVLREPVRHLRSEGIKIITFLDDGIAAGSSFEVTSNGSVVGNWTAEEAMQSSTWRELETVNRVMKRLGVQSHINKAVTDSGVSLDSKLGTFSEHMYLGEETRNKANFQMNSNFKSDCFSDISDFEDDSNLLIQASQEIESSERFSIPLQERDVQEFVMNSKPINIINKTPWAVSVFNS
uniref:CCHC-type domain-containing protein n=1 Tax=Magallana gigas TaxID=29159 RepID=A0A8W8NY55_MAGGI